MILWIHAQSDTRALCISELPMSFEEFTYILKTDGQHIWISKLSVSFDGFTYILKAHGAAYLY